MFLYLHISVTELLVIDVTVIKMAQHRFYWWYPHNSQDSHSMRNYPMAWSKPSTKNTVIRYRLDLLIVLWSRDTTSRRRSSCLHATLDKGILNQIQTNFKKKKSNFKSTLRFTQSTCFRTKKKIGLNSALLWTVKILLWAVS